MSNVRLWFNHARYDWMNHVSCVDMDRGGTPTSATTYTSGGVTCTTLYTPGTGTRQTRTFVYDSGGRVTTATNPENGTVTYAYNTTNTLASKTDAKGQTTAYTYDSNNRVTMVQRYPQGVNYGEDLCQRVTYTYDTNPVNANFSQYSLGRLTTVQYYGQNASSTGSGCGQSYSGYPYASDIYTEMYSYLAAGAVTAKNVSLTRAPGYPNQPYSPASLEVDYTYDSAGRTSTVTYPMAFQNSYNTQPVMMMAYDAMGRPVSMTDPSGDPGTTGSYPPTNWVSGVQYDYAGRQTNRSWLTGLDTNYSPYYGNNSASESRSYNVNGQLASIGWSGSVAPVAQIQYNYSATQNNGQITQEVDSYPYGVGVTTTSYQYDPLKRLTSATQQSTGSAPAPYTQTFQYDGFGNLTQKVLNGTSTPIAVNGATNQLTNAHYDANGNMTSGAGATLTYDEANRVTTATETSGGEDYYGYDASNKRIYQRGSLGEMFTFYGAKGENLGRYVIGSCYPNAFCFVPEMTNLWFGGRLVATTNSSQQPSPVFQDRLGTNRTSGYYPGYYHQSGLVPGWYYPYGEGVPGADTFQFATYTRDSYTGLDYADQRFYASTYGRFNTADRSRKSAKKRNPSSWNRYAYALGDPVNRNDPKGLCSTDGSAYFDSDLDVDPFAVYDLEASGYGYEYDGDCVDNISIDVTIDGLPDDVSIGDLTYASQVIGQVAQYNPGGFLGAFMGASALAGSAAGVTGLAASAAAFAEGVSFSESLLLGPGAYVSQLTGLAYSGYLQIGAIVGASTMGVPTDVWDAMSLGQKQAMLTGGIFQAIQSGMQVVFTVSQADATGFTAFEYDFVTETLGLNVVQQGTSWVVQGTLPPQFLGP